MSAAMTSLIKRAVAPLQQRLRLLISRGAVKLVNDALKCQGLQVSLLSDEVRDDVERFQEYGYTSVPFTDAEALFLSVGGNRSLGVVICVNDRRHRPLSLNEGDVCLFTDLGERVYLNRATDIVHLGAKVAPQFFALADHTHGPGDFMAPAGGGPVTGTATGPSSSNSTKVKGK
jgi:phage baseplate assembly protein V